MPIKFVKISPTVVELRSDNIRIFSVQLSKTVRLAVKVCNGHTLIVSYISTTSFRTCFAPINI